MLILTKDIPMGCLILPMSLHPAGSIWGADFLWPRNATLWQGQDSGRLQQHTLSCPQLLSAAKGELLPLLDLHPLPHSCLQRQLSTELGWQDSTAEAGAS